MKENGERKLRGNCLPLTVLPTLIDTKFVQTEAYIGAQCKGNYKTNQNKSYYKG